MDHVCVYVCYRERETEENSRVSATYILYQKATIQ